MKKLFLSCCALCVAIGLQAAIIKTVNVTSAGELNKLLTDDERNTITDLTLMGNINARDFVTMRDSMTVLENIDISATNIIAYNGSDGTSGTISTTYAANELPKMAFASQVNYVYSPNTTLKSVTLPTSLTTIGQNAFRACKSLTAITVPNSVTTIEFGVFFDCDALSSITLSNTLSLIGVYAFANCKSLKSIVIPTSVTSILQSAFYESGLTAVTIPTGVTTLGDYVFQGCKDLLTVSLSSSVTTIGNDVFVLCNTLTSIVVDEANTAFSSIDGVLCSKDKKTLIVYPNGKKGEYNVPASIITIGTRAFSACDALTAIAIPTTVTSLGDYAFIGCSGLTSITIPSSITSLSKGAFQDCNNLKTVHLPNTLTSFGAWAFYNCTSLTDLTIPASVTSLGDGSITVCPELKSFTVLQSTPINLTEVAYMLDNISRSIPLYVPAGSKVLYAAADKWKEFTNIIELSCVASAPTILAKEANSSQTVNVTANTSWTVTTTADWLAVVPTTEFTGNGSITITAKTANEGASRTATITLSAVGVPTQTITITQAAGRLSDASITNVFDCIVYPNPTTESIAINSDESVEVSVYSGSQHLFSQTVVGKQSVSLAELSAGEYIVVVKTAKGVSSHTIVKQ